MSYLLPTTPPLLPTHTIHTIPTYVTSHLPLGIIMLSLLVHIITLSILYLSFPRTILFMLPGGIVPQGQKTLMMVTVRSQ